MPIRIYIATTEGPVEVQRLTKEDEGVRSVVCVNGTAKALPISRDYDAFIKDPTGVIQRSYDHPSFRMDVSAPITNGNSWQLGAFIAHALFTENLLANPDDEVDDAIWLTGELDRDLQVRPVNHIKEKLEASRDLFEQLRKDDVRLFCFIPGGAGLVPDDEFLEKLNVDGDLLRLESVLEIRRIIERFSLNDPYPPEPEEELEELEEDEVIDLYKSEEDDAAPIKDNRLTRILGFGVAIAALLIGLYMQFENNIIALREGSIHLGIDELRANLDKGCTTPDVIPLEQDGNAFPSSALNGLCGLQITVNNIGSPAYLWAFAQRIEDGHFLLADRESLTSTDKQKGVIGWRMNLPKTLSKSIDYRLVALASSSPLSDAVNRMLRQSFGEGTENWDEVEKLLKEEEITVITALHSIEK